MINHLYSSPTLDRAGAQRRDDEWLAERLRREDTRFALVHQHRNLIELQPEVRARLLNPSELAAFYARADIATSPQPFLLGLHEDEACFGVDVSDYPHDLVPEGARFHDLRRHGSALPGTDAGLLAFARGLVHWQRRHAFCGVCGTSCELRESGHVRACLNEDCNALHFPRTDPAIIVLVAGGDRCLLGRQKTWADGLFSTLAGFVEPGESLEDAVRREVGEEAGITVGAVRYHSSQPWPFPSSLMLGFLAEATSEEITIDAHELGDAAWFNRADLERAEQWEAGVDLGAAGTGNLRLPPHDSIARRLIEDWQFDRFAV